SAVMPRTKECPSKTWGRCSTRRDGNWAHTREGQEIEDDGRGSWAVNESDPIDHRRDRPTAPWLRRPPSDPESGDWVVALDALLTGRLVAMPRTEAVDYGIGPGRRTASRSGGQAAEQPSLREGLPPRAARIPREFRSDRRPGRP